MGTRKNRNTVFPKLSYELAFSHLDNLERDIETNELAHPYKRLVPIAVCTIIEQFCRTKKKFAYGGGEPMPRELKLNVPLVIDMLDWSDSWCTDNTRRHDETIHKHARDIASDGSFKIDVGNLCALIDDACDIRSPLMVESLAASTLNFQGTEAINSLYKAPILHQYGNIGIDEYADLFDRRHTSTHTLAGYKSSPRACVALAKDLFELMLGRSEFLFYRGLMLSNTDRHADAVACLKQLHGRTDWEYLSHYGRSLAHVKGEVAVDMLRQAADSLRDRVKAISKYKTNKTAWLRMEAARAMCDLADGFGAVNDYDGSKSCADEALEICSDLADAYWLVGDRLSKFRFSPDVSAKCFKKAYELEKNVDTAYAVGSAYFTSSQYNDAEEWFKIAEKHDDKDKDVKLALELVQTRLTGVVADETQSC